MQVNYRNTEIGSPLPNPFLNWLLFIGSLILLSLICWYYV